MPSEIIYVIIGAIIIALFVMVYSTMDILKQVDEIEEDGMTDCIVVKASESITCQNGNAESTITYSNPDKTNTQ
jgi:hypothetical protein